MPRTSFVNVCMKHALAASERSTCIRRQVGAAVVRGGKLISTGYNGAPRGLPHCTDIGCIRDELNIPSGTQHEICRATHAEQNALLHAGFDRTLGADIYTTTFPCSICTKMIINAGIVHVYFLEGYPDSASEEYLSQAGILTTKVKL